MQRCPIKPNDWSLQHYMYHMADQSSEGIPDPHCGRLEDSDAARKHYRQQIGNAPLSASGGEAFHVPARSCSYCGWHRFLFLWHLAEDYAVVESTRVTLPKLHPQRAQAEPAPVDRARKHLFISADFRKKDALI